MCTSSAAAPRTAVSARQWCGTLACLGTLALALATPLRASAQVRVAVNTATRVSLERDELLVTFDSKPSFSTFILAKPTRLVIDVFEAVFVGVPSELDGAGRISRVRAESFGGANSAIARLTVFTEDAARADVQYANGALSVRVGTPPQLLARNGEGASASLTAPPSPEKAKSTIDPAIEAKPTHETPRQAQLTAAAEAQRIAEATAAADKTEAEKTAAAKARAEQAARATIQAAEAQRLATEKVEAEKIAAAQAQATQARIQAAEAEAARARKDEAAALEARKAETARAEAAERAASTEAARRGELERAAADAEAKTQAALKLASEAEAERKAAQLEIETARVRDAARAEEAARQSAGDDTVAAAERLTSAPSRAPPSQSGPVAAKSSPKAAPELLTRQVRPPIEPPPARDQRTLPPPQQSHSVAASQVTADVRNIGFAQRGGRGIVTVTTSLPVSYQFHEADNEVVLELENAQISVVNNRRLLDTSFFETAVSLVRPETLPNRRVRVVVKLKRAVPARVTQQGKDILVELQALP